MSHQHYDGDFLRRLRNDIPIASLIRQLDWPCRIREGRFVFLCPRCNETESSVNPRTNLGRCFHCETNFNPIDFAMSARQYDFQEAVAYLVPLLRKAN